MKKTLFVFIILFQMCYVSFAFSLFGENYYSAHNGDTASSSFGNNITTNVGIGFLFPVIDNTRENLEVNVLGSLFLFSAGCGIGGHINILRNVISPGIYADVHVSVLSLLFLFLNDIDKDGHLGKNKDQKYYFGLWQFGIRLYNNFSFGLLDIQPFFGLNAFVAGVGDIKTNGLKTFGILISINNYGIEYSYQLPLRDRIYITDHVIHRIVFIRHI